MLGVSVVIPTDNRADLLAPDARRDRRQTVPPVEIIVVDDGSEDATCWRSARCAKSLDAKSPGAPVAAWRAAA